MEDYMCKFNDCKNYLSHTCDNCSVDMCYNCKHTFSVNVDKSFNDYVEFYTVNYDLCPTCYNDDDVTTKLYNIEYE